APVRRAHCGAGRRRPPHAGREGRPPDLRSQGAHQGFTFQEGKVSMTNVLAAEGGYQKFTLGGGEWFWLFFSAATAVLAIVVGFYLVRGVLAADQGTPKMREIADAIQEGAMAYLRRQFRTIAMIVVPLAVLVFLTSTHVVKPDGNEALSFVQSGAFRTLAFIAGALMSGLTGFIGMSLAVRGNVRTAAAARSGSLPGALRVAFRTGG